MNVWAFKCEGAVYVSVLAACLGCCMLFTMSGFYLAEGRGDVTPPYLCCCGMVPRLFGTYLVSFIGHRAWVNSLSSIHTNINVYRSTQRYYGAHIGNELPEHVNKTFAIC